MQTEFRQNGGINECNVELNLYLPQINQECTINCDEFYLYRNLEFCVLGKIMFFF